MLIVILTLIYRCQGVSDPTSFREPDHLFDDKMPIDLIDIPLGNPEPVTHPKTKNKMPFDFV
jgi:hypothetical protein